MSEIGCYCKHGTKKYEPCGECIADEKRAEARRRTMMHDGVDLVNDDTPWDGMGPDPEERSLILALNLLREWGHMPGFEALQCGGCGQCLPCRTRALLEEHDVS